MTIALSLGLTIHVFYLFNFTYIGTCVAGGIFLKMRKFKYARHIVLFAVGLYMFVYLGILSNENMQIEGFWILLCNGVFYAAVLHYLITKIFGPMLFCRGWCGYACWIAMVLELLPYKIPQNPRKHIGYIRYIVFAGSLIFGVILFLQQVPYKGNIMFWGFILGNMLYYVIGVPGGISGKPIVQMDRLLSEKGFHLDYGIKIRMNANYIISYGSIGLYYVTAMKAYDKRIGKIILDIKNMKTNEIEKYSERIERIYLNSICNIHNMDDGYNINDSCTSCGICTSICPAGNITLNDGRPVFRHQCECCMACIQHCPQKAINYRDKTQKRKRYTHPDISHTEISKYYNNLQS
jgi:ferredoxin